MFLKKSVQNKPQEESAIPRSVAPPTTLPTGVVKALAAKPQVAVFVTHGIGQQIPFETLDAAAEGIARAAKRKGSPVLGIRARTVQIGGVKTQRAEFDIKNAKGQEIEVHVYEGYWSPFTEGEVNIRDVIGFLFRGGLNGLRNCGASFKRYIFGRVVDFGRRPRTAIHLLAALGVVLSLVVLNLLIAAVASEKFFQGNNADIDQAIDIRLAALTSIVAIFVFSSLIFGGALGLLNLRKWTKHPSQSALWKMATQFVQWLFWIWVLVTITSGALLLAIRLKWIAPEQFTYTALSEYWILIWGGLIIASWAVRNLMVQYVGDVAAYTSSHTLDRFNDIRGRIKKTICDLVKALYVSAQYESILLMGHSLGSVISYDVLNSLLNEDELNGGTLQVLDRTKLLLTFGSPLDKTAFLFASQWASTTETREALAASLQPLILKYSPFRDIPWVNVHSRRDIICGDLEFYDDKNDSHYATHKIKSVPDPDALIPLVAHNEYWHNPTLFDELYKYL